MALNIKTEPKEDRQVELLVEVDQARVDGELRKAARKVSRDYRIPGFRQGKAPYSVVVKYIGLPNLFNEFIEPLGEEIYRQALEESDVEPYAQAQLDIDSLEPLTYKFTVPLEPEIDLGDYRSLRVEEPEIEISDEDIDAQLDEMLEEYAEYGEVERPAEYGDLLTIDVKSVIVDDESDSDADADSEDEEGSSEPTVVLDETDWDVTLDEENPMEPPGFDEALLGLSPGDEKEFVLNWPEDSQSIYAGKQAKFNVTLHTIQANTRPEADDEFAQMIGPDFQTLDDLKNNIRESLLEGRKAAADNEYLEKALDALVAQSTMVYPPAVVEDQIDVMVNELERQLRQYGIENAEDYLRQMGQDMDQYRESLRENAEVIAKRNLIISELYSQEGIEATDEEIEERVDRMIGVQEDEQGEDESNQALREMMLGGSGRAVLESQVLQEKSMDRLLAIVRGEELPPKPEPKAEADEEDTSEADSAEANDAEADDADTDDDVDSGEDAAEAKEEEA